MKFSRTAIIVCLGASLASAQLPAQQEESYDYWAFNKALIWRGVQAFMICNGIFTSDRTLEQVTDQELAYVRGRPGFIDGDDIVIDRDRRAVVVGLEDELPAMRSAYRDGLGCITLPPDQDFADIDQLPAHPLGTVERDASEIPWPDGDQVVQKPLPSEIDAAALAAAGEWSFDRQTHGTLEQVTLP